MTLEILWIFGLIYALKMWIFLMKFQVVPKSRTRWKLTLLLIFYRRMVPNCVIFALYVLGTLCNLPWKYLKSVEILFLKNLNEIVVTLKIVTVIRNRQYLKRKKEIDKNFGKKQQVKLHLIRLTSSGAREQIKGLTKICPWVKFDCEKFDF